MKFVFQTVAALLLISGCATRQNLVLDTVGPAPIRREQSKSYGSLAVYTAFDVHAHLIGAFPEIRRYTDYKVFSTDGQLIRTVRNDGGSLAESPVVIELPPGTYRVVAQASRYGKVTVPIEIAPFERTTVNLNESAGNSRENLNTGEAVRLPDGRFVGWRSSSEKIGGTASPVAASR